MRVEVKMPRMGQSMEEGTLLNWLKPVGAAVKTGEPLVEIETDKASIEIEAFATGTLAEILVQTGETVPIGTILAYIDDGRAGKAPTAPAESAPTLKSARINASPVVRRLSKELQIDLSTINGTGPQGRIIKRDIESLFQSSASKPVKIGRLDISPVARRIAKEQQIDLADITGTGPSGRIIKRDVEAHIASQTPAIPEKQAAAAPEKQPISKIKRATARLMTVSKTTVPHFYVSIDINMGQALALRQSLKRQGHEVSVNHLILKAVAITLEDYPSLNAEWADDGVLTHAHINIANAVALMDDDRPAGLITPVVHHCETLSLIELVQAASAVVERARMGQLRRNDLTDGTFTVSNLGMFGVKHFEAIVNPPQAAILAVGTIRRQPAYDAHGNIVPADLMTATLSADHRVTDGAEVASFLRDLKAVLEDGFVLMMD